MDKTAGSKITDIKDREFKQFTTTNAEKIILGLDMSGIPFFAKYNDMSLSLAYDGKRKDGVEEIIKKAESGEYPIIEREISENRAAAYERLLPEIADIMELSVAQLKVSKALSSRLVETYINNWFADKKTIRSKLGQFTDLSYAAVLAQESHEKEVRISAEMPEKAEKERQADTEHREAVIQGDKDHRDKEEAVKKEEKHFFFSGRSNVVKNLRSFVSRNVSDTEERVREEERQRVKP